MILLNRKINNVIIIFFSYIILYMSLDKIKKQVLAIKFISYIIINVIRLRELQTNILNSDLVNKLSLLKDLSKMTYDLLTFNLVSFIFNGVPLIFKFKKLLIRLVKRIKKT